MTKALTPITTSDTFQTWLQRTNDVVSEMGTSVLTASAGAGDSTTGNCTLVGNFVANNLQANTAIVTPSISSTGPTVNITSDTVFTTTSLTPVDVFSSLGPKVKLRNSTAEWSMGLGNSSVSAPFEIGPSSGSAAISISTSGDVTVSKLFLSSSTSLSVNAAVRADRTILTTGDITGGGNLTINRIISLTGNSAAIQNMSTTGNVVRTGSSSFTTRTITNGTGITVTNGDGVSGNPTISVTGLTTTGSSLLAATSVTNVRSFLGLGTAATTNSTAYATSAQGTTADNAWAKANLALPISSKSTDIIAKTGTNDVLYMTPYTTRQSLDPVIKTWNYTSTVTEIVFTDLDQYTDIDILFKRLTFSSSSHHRILLSSDGGATWVTTLYVSNIADDATGSVYNDGMVFIDSGSSIIDGVLRLCGMGDLGIPPFISGLVLNRKINAYQQTVANYNAIKIIPGSGNITAGEVYMICRRG